MQQLGHTVQPPQGITASGQTRLDAGSARRAERRTVTSAWRRCRNLVLFCCWMLSAYGTAAQSAPQDEVAQVLDTFHRAAATADLAAYTAQMGPDMVFLGTDATERWQGQAFVDFARPHFTAGKGWTYTVRERHIDLAPSGDVAWFDELLDNAKLGLCRGSGVLLKGPDGWKLQQYNLSMPVPNEIALDVAAEIRGGEPAGDADTGPATR